MKRERNVVHKTRMMILHSNTGRLLVNGNEWWRDFNKNEKYFSGRNNMQFNEKYSAMKYFLLRLPFQIS